MRIRGSIKYSDSYVVPFDVETDAPMSSDHFDENGNPDVMGARPMSQEQLEKAARLRRVFNEVHELCAFSVDHPPEASRMMAMARTHLELACMCAVKAISRGA